MGTPDGRPYAALPGKLLLAGIEKTIMSEEAGARSLEC
jgi:hypothetical protein